ncbi:MAG: hypothetical protein D6797_05130, partial [Bdellovibrio sp.]
MKYFIFLFSFFDALLCLAIPGKTLIRVEPPQSSIQKERRALKASFGSAQFLSSHTPFFKYGKEESSLDRVGLEFLWEGSQPSFENRLKGRTFFSLEESENYFDLQEAFVGWRWRERGFLYLGRKKEAWSLMDQKWGMGIW